MANGSGLSVTELAGSVGFISAVLVEVGAVSGNGTSLVVVSRTPDLQDAFYLAHLCVVDSSAAASIMPSGSSAAPPGSGTVPSDPSSCRAARFLSAASLPACTLGVAALGSARYRLIVHPSRPGARPAPASVLTAVWSAAALSGALSLLGPPPAPPPAPARCSVSAGGLGPFRPLWAMLAFASPALSSLAAYGSIFSVARRAALRPPRGTRPRSDSLDSRLSFLPPLRPRSSGGKAASAPASAVGQFAACWSPYGCACLAPAARAAAAEATVTWVAYSAFAAHPFLYGSSQRPVRSASGRLTRRASPRAPKACTSQAWHSQTLLRRLQELRKDPVLGPSEAPEQARELARQTPSVSEAT